MLPLSSLRLDKYSNIYVSELRPFCEISLQKQFKRINIPIWNIMQQIPEVWCFQIISANGFKEWLWKNCYNGCCVLTVSFLFNSSCSDPFKIPPCNKQVLIDLGWLSPSLFGGTKCESHWNIGASNLLKWYILWWGLFRKKTTWKANSTNHMLHN